MTDQLYREWMINILTNLEPIQELKGKIIVNELDEATVIYFLSKG